MKTIIVPVDFSQASNNALFFAAEISRRSAARLVLVNILDKGQEEDKSRNNLLLAAANLKDTFGTNLKVETFLALGEFVAAVKKVATDQNADLLVMGTKGASGLKKVLIGSNTVKVLSHTTVPTLVIPESARFEDFLKTGKNRVILATDLENVDNDDALDLLKEIVLLMIEPKVRVLNVRPKNTRLDFLKGMERAALLSRFNPEIESERITVFSSNVISGINLYLGKHDDTGLVAMIARKTGHLIQKHFTHEMASHTHLPLLVLHDKI